MNKNKVGYMEIGEEVLVKFWKYSKDLVPLQVMPPERIGWYKYLMYSDYFRELEEGEDIPIYVTDFTRTFNGDIVISKITEYKKW